MKAYLMHPDRDFDLDGPLPPHSEALVQDLGLDTLFAAMALSDPLLFAVAKRAVLLSPPEPDVITYRQRILSDCLEHPTIVRELYALAVHGVEAEKKVYRGYLSDSPSAVLRRSIEVIDLMLDVMRRLAAIAVEHGGEFGSEGFARLFDMMAADLDDSYLKVVEDHLKRLRFRGGVSMSAQLGVLNKGRNYVLRTPHKRRRNWAGMVSRSNRSSYSFRIPERDYNGTRALAELEDRGINSAANALAQSRDHIVSFFARLRAELAFYVGCLNLHDQLAQKGQSTCFPTPVEAAGEAVLTARGLYDPCLCLSRDEPVVGNGLDADGKSLVVITGANEGGKSTFLRSLGLAHLMMQCGLFVPAECFTADVRHGVFTHFKREEDSSMRSGKFDEELLRMSEIADTIESNALVLFNESFASTNEREGSEIARQIVRALTEAGIKVCFVTHMYHLAHGWFEHEREMAVFLRAERREDGKRTFRLIEGEPVPTSFGLDLYRRIFGVGLLDDRTAS